MANGGVDADKALNFMKKEVMDGRLRYEMAKLERRIMAFEMNVEETQRGDLEGKREW